jgi:hypothetical protein
MAALSLGIGSIVIGVALVCGGLFMWLRASRADPTGSDDVGELRTIIDALEEEDQAERGAMTNVRPRLDQII